MASQQRPLRFQTTNDGFAATYKPETTGNTRESLTEPTNQRLLGILWNHTLNLHTMDYLEY